MPDSVNQELLELNQRLLEAIAKGDWAIYQDLCDPSLTAFEPEALGQLVVGLEFHRFYFSLGRFSGKNNTTMCNPTIRVMGDVAVVAYVRLSQGLGLDGSPVTRAFEETRIWQKKAGAWKHIHFHRSAPATS